MYPDVMTFPAAATFPGDPVTQPLQGLAEGQWSLDGLTFGPGTPFNLARFTIGGPDLRTADGPRAREDGDWFGRDYRGGRTITFELNVLDDDYAVLDALAVLESAWDAPGVRARPDGVSVLSYCRGGQLRRVFGRPRRFDPSSDLDWAGNVPVTCDFRTKGHHFYSDVEFSTTIGFVPEAQGGLILPVTLPLVLSGSGAASQAITVAGTEPAWLGWRVNGPILNPGLEVSGVWSATLDVSLASDQWAVVDPQPWGRGVHRNDGAGLAGKFTPESQRLSLMRVPPGTHEVVLRGQDPTGTSSAQLFHRSVYSSY